MRALSADYESFPLANFVGELTQEQQRVVQSKRYRVSQQPLPGAYSSGPEALVAYSELDLETATPLVGQNWKTPHLVRLLCLLRPRASSLHSLPLLKTPSQPL